MPTTGAYEIRLAARAIDGFIIDDNVQDIEKGEWAWIDRGDVFGDGRTCIMLYFRCTDCGMLGTLWRERGDGSNRGHDIDGQGNVSPLIACGYPGCTFHTQPTRLLGFVDKRGKK